LLIALVTAVAAALLAGATPASASTIDGIATIQTPTLGTLSYPAGSTTQFTVTLPTGAACSGDTATDGYHVYSYLVPQNTNVANVTFVSQPSTGYGLFKSTGGYVGPINTAPTTGVIPSLPNNLEWGPAVTSHSWLSALLDNGGTSGVWEAGVACANASGVVTDYWNTEITFTSNGSDPDGFVWSGVPGDPNNGANPEVPYAIVLPVLAVGVLGGSILIRRRRSARVGSSSAA
jgi:hypothetical protein